MPTSTRWCVLYECLTGHRPFPGDSLESQVAAHLTDPPPQPSTQQPNVPAPFDAVIAKGMAKNPDQRYATTVELADAAHDAITTPLAAPSESTPLDAIRPAPARRDDRVPPAPAPDTVRQQPADLNLAATTQRPPGRPAVPQPRPTDPPPQFGAAVPPPEEHSASRRGGYPSLGGYPTPGGYPPPQGGGYPPQKPYGQSAPPNYLVWSILIIVLSIFTCYLGLIPAIVAIVYANRVKGLWAQGLYDQARSASKKARTWAITGTVLIVIGGILVTLIIIGAQSSSSRSAAASTPQRNFPTAFAAITEAQASTPSNYTIG